MAVDLGNRIVVLIDMDCFFCQVETRLKPEYAGKPLAVVQYNLWRTGGIIAVNYEAREFGVTRHMRGEEAREKCPHIILAVVPGSRGKADTSRYRSAGREVIDVLKKHCTMVERASVDEAYLDITQIVDDQLAKKEFDPAVVEELKTTYVIGHSECNVNNEEQRRKGLEEWIAEAAEDIQIQRLAIAGRFVEFLRQEIKETTTFNCSAGISFNKILAKLACGLHKPQKQTILPASSVSKLFGSLPVKKVRNLGGKLGDMVLDALGCHVMSDLLQYSLQDLQSRFDRKTGHWLYHIARGIDNEPVTPRLVSKSIGACKRFPGKQTIVKVETLRHWLGELSSEISERLEQDFEENERKATSLTVSFHYIQNKKVISQSRAFALTTYKQEKIAEMSINAVLKVTQDLPISFLGVSAGKFIKSRGSENLKNFFKPKLIKKLKTQITNSNNSNENNSETSKNISIPIEQSSNSQFCSTSLKKNDKFSPCSKLQKSLQHEKFKQSFFITVLKENKLKNHKCDDDGPMTGKDKKDKRVENEIEDEKEKRAGDGKKKKRENEEEKQREDKKGKKGEDEKGKDILLECNTNFFADKYESATEFNETVMEKKNEPKSNISFFVSNNAMLKLQEIFPDLNDIDLDVLHMLPMQLQDEAKKFLKVKGIKNVSEDINILKQKRSNSKACEKQEVKLVAKSGRGRPPKCKLVVSNYSNPQTDIQHFFIKTGTNNKAENFKKCLQCHQLILTNKFEEHNDYHVAQNVQLEMNSLPASDERRKRKLSDETLDQFS
ncbi:DNA polymerase eta [Trichogramma pretiosum]|uniref:DNA polymerase eta n=1 Tax=Trichogramma pretiosum TaxID=7493 RepID=UPI000C71B2BF|nr:DNA polymerase eta [Trichogramma pretiosum]